MTRTKKALVTLAVAAAAAGGVATPAFADNHSPISPMGDNHSPISPN